MYDSGLDTNSPLKTDLKFLLFNLRRKKKTHSTDGK